MFDIRLATEAVRAFSKSCDVRCVLYNIDGSVLCEQSEPNSDCSFCSGISKYGPDCEQCQKLHQKSISQSMRFGGRYIYSCPVGLGFFSSPIMYEGELFGAITAGPVILTDVEDILLNEVIKTSDASTDSFVQSAKLLEQVPIVEPARLRFLSEQLFASSIMISDSSHEAFLSLGNDQRQNSIADYIALFKSKNASITPYPIDAEKNLFNAVSNGDAINANEALNELLAWIFCYTTNKSDIKNHIIDLRSVITRAILFKNISSDIVFNMDRFWMKSFRNISGNTELTKWIAEILGSCIELINEGIDDRYSPLVSSAIDYIKQHYIEHITLDTIALHCGYSSCYLSRSFTKETGIAINQWLNEYRINKSKPLLLSSNLTLSQIANLVGFDDQSYFCRVFKKITNLTPGQYMKQQRQINKQKEYGLK